MRQFARKLTGIVQLRLAYGMTPTPRQTKNRLFFITPEYYFPCCEPLACEVKLLSSYVFRIDADS